MNVLMHLSQSPAFLFYLSQGAAQGYAHFITDLALEVDAYHVQYVWD